MATPTIEFKRGYLMRKCTIEAGGKKSKGKKYNTILFMLLDIVHVPSYNVFTSMQLPLAKGRGKCTSAG